MNNCSRYSNNKCSFDQYFLLDEHNEILLMELKKNSKS